MDETTGVPMHEHEEVAIARTEALFREVNERIAESAKRFESHEAEFVCECSDPTCVHRIAAPLDTYESVRECGTQFLLAPGHADERVERVVRERPRYAIVEKFQERVAALVRSLDPRASTA